MFVISKYLFLCNNIVVKFVISFKDVCKGSSAESGDPRLRSPAPTSMQSLLATYCFTFSIEPAIFPYVTPSPSNRYSSRAFGDVVWRVSLCHVLILFFCFLRKLFGECVCYLCRSCFFFLAMLCGV